MRPLIALGLLTFVAAALGAGDAAAGAKNVSKAVEDNGLEVTVAVEKKFEPMVPLAFSVSMKNVGKADLTLIDPQEFRKWHIDVKQVGKDGFWRVVIPAEERSAVVAPARKTLKPGESLEVAVKLEGTGAKYLWEGIQNEPLEGLTELPEGEYQLTLTIPSQAPVLRVEGTDPPWSGKIVTEPVTFTIASKKEK